ncbi:hypothetical protein [Kitasatospora sp. HPMI-4]|uniref:hypothetical protein n=1 Tax=Kitasatospora sp. HPMI-4 TaxID=3448443 RepID=UPI003F1952AE
MTTDIHGDWNLNANGSPGIISIFQDGATIREVFVKFDDSPSGAWEGSWDDVAGQLTLKRSLSNGITQNYVGYIGNNHPDHVIIAGSFTQSDATGPRNHFGWVIWNQTYIT